MLLIAVLVLGASAFAHDPLEITANALLRSGALELQVTMARSTALAVTDGTKVAPTFDPATFATLRPRFEARAASLFVITSAGTALVPRRVEVALTVENDVEFRLVYPRAVPGPLRFEAAHVAKLDSGFGDLLTVQGEHGELLGQQLLIGTDLALEVTAPAGARPASPAPAAASAPAPRPFRLGLAAISAAVVALLVYRLQRRTRFAQ